ncbi:MAG TPA: magnesium and cobalt transport protein CorA, partial [Candidatus Eisenbacteria bacterium]|nr:magnesium and cobalt transport protein CorA [Candidatus Eisenbacteria bacterium]
MGKIIRRRSKKAGLPPGTLVFDGERRVERTRITIFDYDGSRLQEKEAERIEECFPLKDEPTVTWINIDGVHEVENVEKIGG